MSNVHGIGDYDRESGAGNNARSVPILGGGGNNGNPRKENFFSFIKNFCCPLSTWKSFIFAITMIDIIVYLITLCFGIGISTPKNPYLLPPTPETLEKLSLVLLNYYII
jgi:hypothetical protein